MKEQLSDNEIKRLFRVNQSTIEDDGFTETVMRRLPSAPKYGYIIYLFVFAGILAAFFIPGTKSLALMLSDFFISLLSFKMPSMEAIIVTVAVILGGALIFNITYEEGLG